MNAICRHFGVCGGCTWQGLSAEDYRERQRNLIVEPLERYGIPPNVLRDIVSVPPQSRRRATLKVQKAAEETRIGFHALRSHDLVDVHECQVLTPGLFGLTQGLRQLFSALLNDGETAEIYAVEANNGFDMSIVWRRRPVDAIAQIAEAAPKLGVVRVTSGDELLFESARPQVTFGTAAITLPPNAFLQPTRKGEGILQTHASEAVGRAKRIADLFCGCGTFTLPLAERARIHAVDENAPMLAALAAGARGTSGLKPVSSERRDLLRQPLTPAELAPFDAVVLDPPRTGALAQATKLSHSSARRIAYVSCDAASFARDARVLIDGGYRLDWIVGVDQFLWSTHIELAAAFSRH